MASLPRIPYKGICFRWFLSIIGRRKEERKRVVRVIDAIAEEKQERTEEKEKMASSRRSESTAVTAGRARCRVYYEKKRNQRSLCGIMGGDDQFSSYFFSFFSLVKPAICDRPSLKSMYPADKRQLRDAYSAREPDLSFDLNRGNDTIYPGMRVQHPELNWICMEGVKISPDPAVADARNSLTFKFWYHC